DLLLHVAGVDLSLVGIKVPGEIPECGWILQPGAFSCDRRGACPRVPIEWIVFEDDANLALVGRVRQRLYLTEGMGTVGTFEVRKLQHRDRRVRGSQRRAVVQMDGREIDAPPSIGAQVVELTQDSLGFVLIAEQRNRDALSLFVGNSDLTLINAGEGGLLHGPQRDFVGAAYTKLLLQIVFYSGVAGRVTRDGR